MPQNADMVHNALSSLVCKTSGFLREEEKIEQKSNLTLTLTLTHLWAL